MILMWFMILMMMTVMMKSDEVIRARSGDAVLLTADLQGAGLERPMDIRWTHVHMLVSLQNNLTACVHGRCVLLSNGSLSFSRVQSSDSGTYSLQLFDRHGLILKRTDFLLQVEGGSGSTVRVAVTTSCLLLLSGILFFIVMKKRNQWLTSKCSAGGSKESDVYMDMASHHGNKGKEEQQQDEESHYVTCHPVISTETPITQQSGDEDVYV
ncbi:uncharacterized protein V6R79_002141 [Siganus canaliculatus]